VNTGRTANLYDRKTDVKVVLCGLWISMLTLESGRPAAWGRIGLASVVASIAVNAANQAVHGVSNHVMVHRLAAAIGETPALIFEAAFAVRQIEVAVTSYFRRLLGVPLDTRNGGRPILSDQ
jgi:hypothetical protein